uniref:Uncharacterized protein n=1 Tax=Solanum tuberosum TaxID=4113 RepID=M1D1S4_SOLTU
MHNFTGFFCIQGFDSPFNKVEEDIFSLVFSCFFLKEASDIVDVESIKHIAENQTLIGDVVGKTADDWKAQKELFYQKTGILHQPVKDSVDVVGKEHDKSQQRNYFIKKQAFFISL